MTRGRGRSRARPGGLVGGGGDARPGERGPLRRGATARPHPGVGPALAVVRRRARADAGVRHRLPHVAGPWWWPPTTATGPGPTSSTASSVDLGLEVERLTARRVRQLEPNIAPGIRVGSPGHRATTRSTTDVWWPRLMTAATAARSPLAPRRRSRPSRWSAGPSGVCHCDGDFLPRPRGRPRRRLLVGLDRRRSRRRGSRPSDR